jgi:NDP-4-keto-2,6-dideoxyhexose 3-C-methyltransferase
VWEFEQHYLVSMLGRVAYDSICHEHISYYSLQQIKWMADRVGLKIVGISTNDINGGSISVIAARKEAPYPEAAALIAKFLHDETAVGLGTLAPYHEFARRVAAHRLKLRDFLGQARRDGKVVFGYGASTKGNVILQYCNLTARDLPHIVEKYSAKYGRLTPGTRISIIPEAEAYVRRPDYMLVLPWYFREEIIAREQAYLQQGGALVFVLPDLEVVTSKNM